MSYDGPAETLTCPTCGGPMKQIDQPVTGRRKGLATASLVIGILSLLTLGGLTVGPVLGLVFGAVALSKAKAQPMIYSGRGRAITGMTISVIALLMGLVIIPLILTFGIRPLKVEGVAMMPTLVNGDRILIWQQLDEIERGDIAVFWYPDDPSKSFIKRVIGLPGERIRIDWDGVVYINDQPLDEPYVAPDNYRSHRRLPETIIKPHYYFVMGDNRDSSNDSRSWGLVPEKYIYGILIGKYYSAE